MNRLLVPALVLLFAVGFPGTAGAQPLTPPPVEPPEILPPGAGAPGPAAPAPPSQGPPAAQDDQRDGILPPGATGSPVTTPVASPASDAAASLGAPVVVGDSTVETTAATPRRRRPLAALNGGVGLLRTSAADVGDRWDLRLALTGEFSSSEDFLVRGSRNRRLAGTLAAGVTVARRFEVFGALLASSNRNDRCATGPDECLPEPDRLDPTLIRAFGDLVLGGKLAAPVTRAVRLGAEAGLRLLTGSDGPGFEGDATSAWVTALGTWDLRPQALPLVLHFNLGFYLDNSANLQDPARFSSNMLASRSVATFAYGIGRDRLRSSVALAAPMERRVGAVALEPFIEYHFELVTDDPDPAYQAFAPPRCLSSSSNCAGNRDQHWLSFGLRTSLGGGFALLGGLDLGVRSPGYPYGSALLPFNVLFGARQALGLAPPPPRRFTRTVTVERRVAVAARPASGQVQLEVGAPGFQPQSVSAMVTPGQTTAVQVTLEPVPAPAPALPPPAPVRIEAGRVVTSGPIGFVDETGAEPALTAEAQATLAQLAPQLAAPSAPAHIRIEAHWDNGLPRAEAEALTRRQAEVVAAYLVERGVPRDRLQPVGLGATRPRVPNLGPTSRSKNRRVELVVGR
jgi:hypothetical protein